CTGHACSYVKNFHNSHRGRPFRLRPYKTCQLQTLRKEQKGDWLVHAIASRYLPAFLTIWTAHWTKRYVRNWSGTWGDANPVKLSLPACETPSRRRARCPACGQIRMPPIKFAHIL